MYTIKNVAEKVGESEHTIRYYCKIGLFPFCKRDKNNIRMFTEDDLQGVRIVLCLRDTGMPLSDIKHYIDLCTRGKETLQERLEIIRNQKKAAYEKLDTIQKQIQHLEWKEKYYEETIKNDKADDCNVVQW